MPESLFNKVACFDTGVFCEFYETSKNIFFYNTSSSFCTTLEARYTLIIALKEEKIAGSKCRKSPESQNVGF